jgi:hypothetical protein
MSSFTAIQVIYEMMRRIRVQLNPGFTREKQHSKRIRLFLPADWTLIYGKLVKYYIWSLAFYGTETWTLRKADQNSLEGFETWCWKRMEMIWTDRARNGEALHRFKKRNIVHTIKRRKAISIGPILRSNCLLNTLLKKE